MGGDAGEEKDMEVDVSEPEMDGVEMEPEMDMEEPSDGMKSHEEKVQLIQALARELFNDPEIEIEIESEDAGMGDEMGDEMEEMPPAGEEGSEDMSDEEVMSEEAQSDEGEELEEGNLKKGSVPSPKKIKGQDHKMKPAGGSNKNSVGSKKMEESRDALKKQIVEQVAKRVAERLRSLK
jgi:hypothetical protein